MGMQFGPAWAELDQRALDATVEINKVRMEEILRA